MSSLVIVNGPSANRRFALTHRPLSLGRGPGRDIQILDPKASRRHALVRILGGRCVLTPLASLNGVAVNGKDITDETILDEGDEIRIGGTLLRLETVEAQPAPDAARLWKSADTFARAVRTMLL